MALRIRTAFGSSGVKSRLSPRPVCPVGTNAAFSQVRQQHKSPSESLQEVLMVPPRKEIHQAWHLGVPESQVGLVCRPLA